MRLNSRFRALVGVCWVSASVALAAGCDGAIGSPGGGATGAGGQGGAAGEGGGATGGQAGGAAGGTAGATGDPDAAETPDSDPPDGVADQGPNLPDVPGAPDAADVPGVPDTAGPDLPPPGCGGDDECADHGDGVCMAGVCQADGECGAAPVADGSPCDDGQACTQGDSCQGGSCAAGAEPDCDDGNACTDDACDPATGACVSLPNSAPCDDGDACTLGDTCQGGACFGQPSGDCVYTSNPNIGSCQPGTLHESQKQLALDRVNYIRALSGLPPVVYDPSGDQEAQAAALIMVANSDLDHEPPQSWACWSQAGFNGASSSNLHISWGFEGLQPDSPADTVDGWMIDYPVNSLGHRRWIIDPFMGAISYGAAHGPAQVPSSYPHAFAAALKVIGVAQQSIAGLGIDFVAYPVGDYPSQLVDKEWFMSFIAISDEGNKWGNGSVKYGAVTVSVTSESGQSLDVTNVSGSNAGFGVPNHLQWRVVGLQDGVTYTVTISGVSGAPQSTYTYDFRLL